MNIIKEMKTLRDYILEKYNKNEEYVFTDNYAWASKNSVPFYKLIAFRAGIEFLSNNSRIHGMTKEQFKKIDNARVNILSMINHYKASERQEVLDSLKILSDFLDTL